MRAFTLLSALFILGLITVTLAADPPKGGKAGGKAGKDAGKDDHDEHHDGEHEDEHHRPGDPDMSSVKEGDLDHDAVTGKRNTCTIIVIY